MSPHMDAPADHPVRAQALEPDAFAPFGEVIRPRASGRQFDNAAYDPEAGEREARLVLCNGQPRLWIMHLFDRGLRFSQLARHRRVSQCLGSLGGRAWFIAVAPPPNLPEEAGPRLADVRAFRVPGDCVIKLHVGTWHAGPHFTGRECMFFNLENLDTNKRDFHSVDLPRSCAIKA